MRFVRGFFAKKPTDNFAAKSDQLELEKFYITQSHVGSLEDVEFSSFGSSRMKRMVLLDICEIYRWIKNFLKCEIFA